MLGILFFLLTGLIGLFFVILVIPELFLCLEKSYDDKPLQAPAFIIVLPAAILVGTVFAGWFMYILAYCFSKSGDGLKYAEIVFFTVSSLFIIIASIKYKNTIKDYIQKLFINTSRCDICILLFALCYSSFIDIYSFYHKGNAYYIGDSVSEDMGVHLDIIRSFSNGNNFPTEYPLFSGIDMRYHFMFQFYTSILEHLGLRIDLSINLISIVFLVSAFSLLYALAVKLFNKRLVGALSIIFTMFRSSTAFVKYIFELASKGQPILKTLAHNMSYIGYTFNEFRGLYNVNVYANQRHFALGICSLIFTIILFLQRFEPTSKIFSKEAWFPNNYKLPIIAGIILGLTGFYHGSCVIGCLAVLLVMALFSTHKLEYALTAFITYILVSLQANFFAKESIVTFRFEPGYLAYNEPENSKYNMNIVFFLIMLLGIFLFLLILALFVNKGKYRCLLLSFLAPFVFAFIFKLSVETETNHKFIIISCMLCNIYIAGILLDHKIINPQKIYQKAIFIFLIFLMTSTGLFDLYTFFNINNIRNNGKIILYDNDPVTTWIMENSDSRDVFLTYEYKLTQETIAGPMLFYGNSYPTWSAGYDIYSRYIQVINMYEANNSDDLDELCTSNNIRFIIIDDNVRNCPDYQVREDIISETYECVFSYNDNGNIVNIYDTNLIVAH